MKKYKFKAPLAIKLSNSPKAKAYRINLNQYRNWHFQVSNNLKIKYKKLLADQLSGLKINPPVEITFTLFNDSKRRIDRSNVLSIQEKFFCDALVEFGCFPDDNDNYIKRTIYQSGKVDSKNGRVEIEIKELK